MIILSVVFVLNDARRASAQEAVDALVYRRQSDRPRGNKEFVKQHIADHEALGDFFVSKKDDIKMGDTPSVAWLLKGTPDDPSQPGGGGRFVRAWERPDARFERITTKGNRIEFLESLPWHSH